MNAVRGIISTAPEIFLLLSMALGTVLGRIKIHGFSLGTTACTLIVAVLIGRLGGTGLIAVLIFAFFGLDPGTASGLAAGALTQSSVIGTASGALAQLGLPEDVLEHQEANIAAGHAVTYVLGYILTLIYVPLLAPKMMRIDLKVEAKKLEARR